MAIAEYAGELIARGSIRSQLTIPDAIIAATAIKHQLSLVTLNIRDFELIPGLHLYPLSKRLS
jgi:predicted nucleic acid-binding protein